MKQEEIDYFEIMDLGFNEVYYHDRVFTRKYGYECSYVTLHMTKKIYIDLDKVSRKCEIIRMDSAKKKNIVSRMPIKNLEQLKSIITFFKG